MQNAKCKMQTPRLRTHKTNFRKIKSPIWFFVVLKIRYQPSRSRVRMISELQNRQFAREWAKICADSAQTKRSFCLLFWKVGAQAAWAVQSLTNFSYQDPLAAFLWRYKRKEKLTKETLNAGLRAPHPRHYAWSGRFWKSDGKHQRKASANTVQNISSKRVQT